MKKMRKMNRRGFTLVEIMIVVAIIGLLAAIAIPNFINARATAIEATCEANLRQLQGAVEMALFDGLVTEAALASTTVTLQEASLDDYIRTVPEDCPAAGTQAYTITVGVVACPTHGTPE